MSTAQERHPHVYVSKDEDPHTRKRTVPLEVISCGYSRTGTMSLSHSAFKLMHPVQAVSLMTDSTSQP